MLLELSVTFHNYFFQKQRFAEVLGMTPTVVRIARVVPYGCGYL